MVFLLKTGFSSLVTLRCLLARAPHHCRRGPGASWAQVTGLPPDIHKDALLPTAPVTPEAAATDVPILSGPRGPQEPLVAMEPAHPSGSSDCRGPVSRGRRE